MPYCSKLFDSGIIIEVDVPVNKYPNPKPSVTGISNKNTENKTPRIASASEGINISIARVDAKRLI